ncbi:MAG: PAS domain-containing protein [Blautia marasmi]
MVEYRIKRRDGSYIWVHDLAVVTAGNGRPNHFRVYRHLSPEKGSGRGRAFI